MPLSWNEIKSSAAAFVLEWKNSQTVRGKAEKMGQLHDRLKEIGYTGHQLELYLVRLLFCLFADDTGIFEPPNMLTRELFVEVEEQRKGRKL